MLESTGTPGHREELRVLPIEGGSIELHGILHVPEEAHGLVILARGVAQEESSIQQRVLAQTQPFHAVHLATLVVDLFTGAEVALDKESGYFSQNTSVMQQRLISIAEWLSQQPETEKLAIGIFGIGPVGAAALIAAAERPDILLGTVAVGNSVALAKEALPKIIVPTLLIAGANDTSSVQADQEALASFKHEKQFEQVAGVSDIWENEESSNTVLKMTSEWFAQRLVTIPAGGSSERTEL